MTRKYGPHGELFFFLIKKEPELAPSDEIFSPVFSADTLKKCALIVLHLLAEDGGWESSGSPSPDPGDMWRQGCPKSPEGVSFCSASEESFGSEKYEQNCECRAFEVIGQDRSSEVVALFLEDWEHERVALS